MQEADVQIALSGDEALVLLLWIVSFNEHSDTPLADRAVLAIIEALLEGHLVTPFLPNYLAEVETARARYTSEFDVPESASD